MSEAEKESGPAAEELSVLDRERLKALGGRLEDNFAGGYLTLISIVLGVALTVLTDQLFDGGSDPSWPPFTDPIYWRASMAFLMICGAFYYYYFFVSLVRMLPMFFEMFIPFPVGTGIVVMTHLVKHQQAFWWLAGINFFLAAAAFFNSLAINNEEFYGNAVKKWFRVESFKNIAFFAAMGAGTIWRLNVRSADVDEWQCVVFQATT